jgi:hypothetical protein
VEAEHNARHRQRVELPALFTSVPKLFRYACEIGKLLRGFLKHAAVRKTIASANVKSRSAKC